MKSVQFFLSIVFFVCIGRANVFAQGADTSSKENFKVSYGENKDHKNSVFTIENDKGLTFVRGEVKDNKPSATWICYNQKGDVTFKYDFASNKITFIDKKAVLMLDYTIDSKDQEVQKGARVPLLVSSLDYYKQILLMEFKDVLKTKIKGQGGKILAKFDAMVDKNGKAKYIVTYSFDGLTNSVTIFPETDKYRIYWIPANYKGRNYDAVTSFSQEFLYNPSTYRRSIWTY